MLFGLAMDTQWEGTLSTCISFPVVDSVDEYVLAEEEDIDHSGPVTRSKARKLQHEEATSKPNRKVMAHFGDETFIHLDPLVTSQPQNNTVTKMIIICREFGINSPSNMYST